MRDASADDLQRVDVAEGPWWSHREALRATHLHSPLHGFAQRAGMVGDRADRGNRQLDDVFGRSLQCGTHVP